MAFMGDLTIRDVPIYVKGLGIFIVFVVVGLSIYAIYTGFSGGGVPEISSIEAAVYLISTLSPIFAIAFVVTVFASTESQGPKRYRRFLSVDIPSNLKKVITPPINFGIFNEGEGDAKVSEVNSEVLVCYYKDDFCADYIVRPNDIEFDGLYLRLEINVFRMNVNIGMTDRDIKRFGVSSQDLTEIFPHTFNGADLCGNEGDSTYSYTYNQTHFLREVLIDGKSHNFRCFVASMNLPEDFIHKKAHRLYFTQDLVLMVRSLFTELNEFIKS